MSIALLTRVVLTDELLHETWDRMRRSRTHWPADFALAMADPLVSRLVRINAALRVRHLAGVDQAAKSPRKARPSATAPAFSTSTHHTAIDRKRAAAADLD